jgi:hypothetical protein
MPVARPRPRERGILFSEAMRAAINEDRKTQTRRVAIHQWKRSQVKNGYELLPGRCKDVRKTCATVWDNGTWHTWDRYGVGGENSVEQTVEQAKDEAFCSAVAQGFLACPYGRVGDLLYIKEPHYLYGHWQKGGVTKTGRPSWRFVAYSDEVRYDDAPPDNVWHSIDRSIDTGWYLRSPLFMPKRAARRWLEILDVRVQRIQEIIEADIQAEGCPYTYSGFAPEDAPPYREWIARLWDSINASRGYGFDTNPWVWAYTFKKVKR